MSTDEYAREIIRVLRPDGWLMLSTPDTAAWFNRIGLLAGLQPAFTEVSFERVFGRPGSDLVGHLRLFTWKSTVQFLEYHGSKSSVSRAPGSRPFAVPPPMSIVCSLASRRSPATPRSWLGHRAPSGQARPAHFALRLLAPPLSLMTVRKPHGDNGASPSLARRSAWCCRSFGSRPRSAIVEPACRTTSTGTSTKWLKPFARAATKSSRSKAKPVSSSDRQRRHEDRSRVDLDSGCVSVMSSWNRCRTTHSKVWSTRDG